MDLCVEAVRKTSGAACMAVDNICVVLLKRIFLEGIQDGGKITLAGVR